MTGEATHCALLIDDELHWIEPIATWLRRRGVTVRRAQDAQTAMSLLHSERPSIVWLDIYLAAGSERLDKRLRRVAQEHWGGVLILEEIQRLHYEPILVVATGSVSNVVALKEICGMDFLLVGKPFDHAEVAQTLNTVAERLSLTRGT